MARAPRAPPRRIEVDRGHRRARPRAAPEDPPAAGAQVHQLAVTKLAVALDAIEEVSLDELGALEATPAARRAT
jgi:hypothetical protein